MNNTQREQKKTRTRIEMRKKVKTSNLMDNEIAKSEIYKLTYDTLYVIINKSINRNALPDLIFIT